MSDEEAAKSFAEIIGGGIDTGFADARDILDGLQANEYNLHSSLQTSNGLMYFGGINGYNAFKSDDIIESNYTSRIVLTGLNILGKEMLVSEIL